MHICTRKQNIACIFYLVKSTIFVTCAEVPETKHLVIVPGCDVFVYMVFSCFFCAKFKRKKKNFGLNSRSYFAAVNFFFVLVIRPKYVMYLSPVEPALAFSM